MRDLLHWPDPVRKELRPHQVRALDLIRISAGKGNRRIVCQMPTGAGKTLTAAHLIDAALAKGNRVIFTAPAVALIDQTVAAFEAEGIHDVGVMQANHPRTNRAAPVQIASVQTLARRSIPDAALVIVDEAHIRSEVIDRLLRERRDVFFIGLSATPWRAGMAHTWDDLVIPCTIADLIRDGFLSEFTAYAPDVPDLRGVKVQKGEYVESALERVMGDHKLMGHVLETWLDKGEDRPTLGFAVNRAHARALAQKFAAAGVPTEYVDGETDRVEREIIGCRFRNGDVRVIWSVRTMTTGVDLPVSCLIDAAPTMSEMLHVQKIGRGLRVNPGTEDCVILDHAGNSLRLGLATDIHHATLDDSKPGDKRGGGEAKPKVPTPCSKCETLYRGIQCPACGHERKPPAVEIEAKEGELVALGDKRPKPPTTEDKQRFWSMALAVDAERGKGGRLAKGLYKGKFGVWPRGLKDIPKHPDMAFLRYEKSRRIAYARMKEKERGAA